MAQRQIKCCNCGSVDHDILTVIRGNRDVDIIASEHYIVVCMDCGLVFINPQHDDEDYAEYYKCFNRNSQVNYSRQEVLDKHRYRRIHAEFLASVLATRVIPENPRLLDVGCGLGSFMHFCMELGFQAEGLEQSITDVDFVREEMGFLVREGWLFDNNLPKDTYDVLTCTAVIEHFTDPLQALLCMNRLLKPGGFLFVNTQDLRGMVLRNGLESWFKFVHTFYYTGITLNSLIGQAGFNVIRTWEMKPILKYSNYVYPNNFCSGELNVVAQKGHVYQEELPLHDDPGALMRAFSSAKRRDYPYQIAQKIAKRRILGAPIRKVGGKLFKRQDVFKDFFNSEGKVVLPTSACEVD
jgi:SAM-dependent methyltransferase